MEQGNKILYQGGIGEIEEKKSRFIATTLPIASQEEALAFIEKTKKQYWDARHNCTAFTIGNRHQLTRCSDDGEPAGTAGRPMLDVLLGEDIHDTAVVVTRYFGGTLLGTGGLVRAYSGAVQEGLRRCVILEKREGTRIRLCSDYSDVGKLQYLIAQNEIPLLSSSYTDQVLMEALVPSELLSSFLSSVTDSTGGRVCPEKSGSCLYALLDGEVLLFDKEESK